MKVSFLLICSLVGLTAAQTCPDTGVNGFASVGSGTTGGGNASPITVTDAASLKNAAGSSGAKVIVVKGTINVNGAVKVSSDKTIRGSDASATIVGGFDMNGVQNIIIKNLRVQAGNSVDTIASRDSHHIWYDHLELWDAKDGLLDITIKSDYQTVSWCKFWYSNPSAEHRLASLVGSGGGDHPEDEGKLHVTYHHNWWAQNVDQRMPRVMYGEGHIYNNYYNSPGNTYCIAFGSYGSVLIQNNYFQDVRNPHQSMYDVYAYAAAEGNVYDKTTGSQHTGLRGTRHVGGQEWATADPVKPPYSFSLDAASGVPDLVKRCAGPRASSSGGGNPPPPPQQPQPTSTSKTPTPTDGGGSCSGLYGQCGGSGWTGPRCCSQGSCKFSNDWYSQCL